MDPLDLAGRNSKKKWTPSIWREEIQNRNGPPRFGGKKIKKGSPRFLLFSALRSSTVTDHGRLFLSVEVAAALQALIVFVITPTLNILLLLNCPTRFNLPSETIFTQFNIKYQ
jgi:hypothetical protein